jgi:hypothetical protein
VLKKYEEHAHYIEWDRAEEQVKFIKQIEELNIRPKLTLNTPWFATLGPAALKNSAVDSEFAPDEDSNFMGAIEERPEPQEPPPVSQTIPPLPGSWPQPPSLSALDKIDVNLSGLGNSGKGAYGLSRHRPSAPQSIAGIQPNINAMSPRQFRAYLDSLRKLRPAFLKFLRKELSKARAEGRSIKSTLDPETLTDERLILELGKEGLIQDLHKFFLKKHFQEKFATSAEPALEEEEDPSMAAVHARANANKPQPIQQQPHKFAGLMYAMPTDIETYYSGRAEPGLIVQDATPTNLRDYHAASHQNFIASFAGLATMLPKSEAGPDVAPLIEPYTETGINTPRVADASGNETICTSMAERRMRLTKLQLSEPPKVVGSSAASHPLKTIKVIGTVAVDDAIDNNWRDNPYPPGSMNYVSASGSSSKEKSSPPMANPYGIIPPMYGAKNRPLKKSATYDEGRAGDNRDLLKKLQTMARPRSWAQPPLDKEG